MPEPKEATEVTGGHLRAKADGDQRGPVAGIVGVAAVAHGLLSFGLLALLDVGADDRAVALEVVAAIVALTAITAMVAGIRERVPSYDRLAQVEARLFALVPAVGAGIAAPFLISISESVGHAIALSAVVVASTVASGLATAVALSQGLTTFGARRIRRKRDATAPQSHGSPSSEGHATSSEGHAAPPQSLAARLARQSAGIALGIALVTLAHALARSHSLLGLLNPLTYAAATAMLTSLALTVLSAASAGLSPGRDVRALAARLDAIGWDDSDTSRLPLASPIRLTSFDAVGELFRSLERLRARLADDVRTYQHALDRTHAADKAKAEFLTAVSHELRTPLNSIMGFAQLLLETDLNESQAEDVRLILAGGRQLHDLIEDILDLSMIESGELQLRFAPCELHDLLDELVAVHQAQVRERGIELVTELPSEPLEIRCDRKRIGQVLTNLLSNAIKFTEEGGVTVRARNGDEGVIIEVIDTGIGIAEGELANIFEEYQQAGSRTRKLGGTGLGLAIARRIARAHGGSLEAESELGLGSTFRLRLAREEPES